MNIIELIGPQLARVNSDMSSWRIVASLSNYPGCPPVSIKAYNEIPYLNLKVRFHLVYWINRNGDIEFKNIVVNQTDVKNSKARRKIAAEMRFFCV